MKKDVPSLQAAITKITGKATTSEDLEYLTRRHAHLLKNPPRVRARGRRGDRYGATTTVLAVSMHGAAKDATKRIAAGEQLAGGVSELVRVAVSEYAAKRGYDKELKHFEATE